MNHYNKQEMNQENIFTSLFPSLWWVETLGKWAIITNNSVRYEKSG